MPFSGRGVCVCRCGRSVCAGFCVMFARPVGIYPRSGRLHLPNKSPWPPSLVQTTLPHPEGGIGGCVPSPRILCLHMRLQRLSGHVSTEHEDHIRGDQEDSEGGGPRCAVWGWQEVGTGQTEDISGSDPSWDLGSPGRGGGGRGGVQFSAL